MCILFIILVYILSYIYIYIIYTVIGNAPQLLVDEIVHYSSEKICTKFYC